MPGGEPAESEAPWRLLTSYLDLALEFEVFIVGCSDEATRSALRARLRRYGEHNERRFIEPRLVQGMPEDALAWLARQRAEQAETRTAGLYYLALGSDARARFVMQRLNEQRDNLRRELYGTLVLVGLGDVLSWLPAEAPDFWSGRTQSFSFSSLAPPAEQVRWRTEELLLPPLDLAPIYPSLQVLFGGRLRAEGGEHE